MAESKRKQEREQKVAQGSLNVLDPSIQDIVERAKAKETKHLRLTVRRSKRTRGSGGRKERGVVYTTSGAIPYQRNSLGRRCTDARRN